MITKEIAITTGHGVNFHHVTLKNSDGTPLRARKNGQCKTWKTRPNDFRVPIKHGMYDHGYITQDNADEWVTEDELWTITDGKG